MRRLRPFPKLAELERIYKEPYNHERWEDHKERVKWTQEILTTFVAENDISYIVDPACGDGAILRAVPDLGITKRYADFNAGNRKFVELEGPLEGTLAILRPPDALHERSMIILTEIIEHVEDPKLVLSVARHFFDHLLLTTPIDEDPTIHDNPQHIWAWSIDEMRDLLVEAGWKPRVQERLDTFWYDYQLWICG